MFWIVDWILLRYGVLRPGTTPVWAMETNKQRKDKGSSLSIPQVPGDRALVLFTRHTTWDTMRPGFDAEAYAEEIRVTQGIGEGGEVRFAAELPSLGDPIPSWAADFFCVSR
jgi:hypothetical protein